MINRTALLATAAATLATTGVIVANGAAQQPTGRTISLVTKNCHFKAVDLPPQGHGRHALPGAGDYIVISCPTFDAAAKRAGDFDGTCHETQGGRKLRSVCESVYALPNGEIHTLARTVGLGAVTGSVVGGTGDYTGARGTFTSHDRPGEKGGDASDNTITLLP